MAVMIPDVEASLWRHNCWKRNKILAQVKYRIGKQTLRDDVSNSIVPKTEKHV